MRKALDSFRHFYVNTRHHDLLAMDLCRNNEHCTLRLQSCISSRLLTETVLRTSPPFGRLADESSEVDFRKPCICAVHSIISAMD